MRATSTFTGICTWVYGVKLSHPRSASSARASTRFSVSYSRPQRSSVTTTCRVRNTRQPLKEWVDSRVQAIIDGRVPNADRTFVHYWLKNGGLGANFRRKDIVFECFHNFLTFSQLGNMTYNVMSRLEAVHGDPAARSWFERTMARRPENVEDGAFTPLDRFVMELFRMISPNGGSLSVLPRRLQYVDAEFNTGIHPPSP